MVHISFYSVRTKTGSFCKPGLPRTHSVDPHFIFVNLFIEIFNYFIEQTFVCESKQRPAKWEQAKVIYSELATARESAAVSCILAESQRLAEKWESSRMEEEREGFGSALIGGRWPGEAVGGLIKSGWWSGVPVWLWLVLNRKQGHKLGNASIIKQNAGHFEAVVTRGVWPPEPVARDSGLTFPQVWLQLRAGC